MLEPLIKQAEEINKDIDNIKFETLSTVIPNILDDSNLFICEVKNRIPIIEKRRTQLIEIIDNNKKDLKFFDYFLWGVFGNYNKKKVLDESINEVVVFDNYINDLKFYNFNLFSERLLNKEKELIEQELKRDHQEYIKLTKSMGKLDDYISNLGVLIYYADNALSHIDSAESSETLDLFTSSKVISVMSYMDVDSAKDSIMELVDKCQSFNEIYANEIHNANDFDLIVDIVFDAGFLDFIGSWGVLDSLSKAKEQILSFKESIEKRIDKSKSKKTGLVNSRNEIIESKCITETLAKEYEQIS